MSESLPATSETMIIRPSQAYAIATKTIWVILSLGIVVLLAHAPVPKGPAYIVVTGMAAWVILWLVATLIAIDCLTTRIEITSDGIARTSFFRRRRELRFDEIVRAQSFTASGTQWICFYPNDRRRMLSVPLSGMAGVDKIRSLAAEKYQCLAPKVSIARYVIANVLVGLAVFGILKHQREAAHVQSVPRMSTRFNTNCPLSLDADTQKLAPTPFGIEGSWKSKPFGNYLQNRKPLALPHVVPPKVDPCSPLVQPDYPVRSRMLMQGGTVVMLLTVNEIGRVVDATVDQSSGYNVLDEAAINTAKSSWRLLPGRVDGRPATMQYKLAVTFKPRF